MRVERRCRPGVNRHDRATVVNGDSTNVGSYDGFINADCIHGGYTHDDSCAAADGRHDDFAHRLHATRAAVTWIGR
jgi:hypothetical protein